MYLRILTSSFIMLAKSLVIQSLPKRLYLVYLTKSLLGNIHGIYCNNIFLQIYVDDGFMCNYLLWSWPFEKSVSNGNHKVRKQVSFQSLSLPCNLEYECQNVVRWNRRVSWRLQPAQHNLITVEDENPVIFNTLLFPLLGGKSGPLFPQVEIELLILLSELLPALLYLQC